MANGWPTALRSFPHILGLSSYSVILAEGHTCHLNMFGDGIDCALTIIYLGNIAAHLKAPTHHPD